MLVLNLGHSPLYRHFYKCLYIELLDFVVVLLFDTFSSLDNLKASFHCPHLSKKMAYCQFNIDRLHAKIDSIHKICPSYARMNDS